jgi:2-polyprenyl-6-methoxyphenol hydroxylase-like FAD-dependent oxidoreductase
LKIAIVGCGPAGLAAALMLYRDGHHVVMFERFDTPRPVGSGIILQPTGLAVLRELDLHSDIHSYGRRIDNMHGVSVPSGKTVLDVNYNVLGDDFHGLAVHRAALFDVLYAAVQACGVEIQTGVEVKSIEGLTQPQSGSFDFVIDASGARFGLQHHAAGRLGRELAYGALWGSFRWPGNGFAANTLDQRYVGAHRMIGVLPIGQHAGATTDQVAFFWSIRTDRYEAWLSRGLDAWKNDVRSIWPETEAILDQVSDPSQMALARYGHGTMRRPYRDKVVFLGDSAHSTSPQLGQGANMALLDAWTFASALRNSRDPESAMRNYAKSRRWHVRAFQLTSLALTPFYQSDSRILAALRDLLFDPVSKLPIARRVVAGLISGMLAGPPSDLNY